MLLQIFLRCLHQESLPSPYLFLLTINALAAELLVEKLAHENCRAHQYKMDDWQQEIRDFGHENQKIKNRIPTVKNWEKGRESFLMILVLRI